MTTTLRRTGVIITAGALVAAVAAVGADRASARTAGPRSATLITAATTVTTSTHAKLAFRLTGVDGGGTARDGLTVSLGRGRESHAWTFRLPASAAKLVAGRRTITTGSAIAPYGAVNLTVSAGGTPTRTGCGANSTLSYPATVRGTVFLDTRSTGAHAWGRVGSRTKAFAFRAGSRLVLTYGTGAGSCGGGGVPATPCSTATYWVASHGSTLLSGGSTVLFGSRSVALAKPAGATRVDTVSAPVPAPTLAASGAKGTMTVRTSGRGASGAATLSSAHGSTVTFPCGTAGRHLTMRSWSDATYRNAGTRLALTAQVFGAITLPNLTNQAFGRMTTS